MHFMVTSREVIEVPYAKSAQTLNIYECVTLSLTVNANVQKPTHLWILLEQKPERRADKSCS